MKKTISVFLFLIIALSITPLSACFNKNINQVDKKEWEKALNLADINCTVSCIVSAYNEDEKEEFGEFIGKELLFCNLDKYRETTNYSGSEDVYYEYYYKKENDGKYKYYYSGENLVKEKTDVLYDDTGYVELLTCFCYNYESLIFDNQTKSYIHGKFTFKGKEYLTVSYFFLNGKLDSCRITEAYGEDGKGVRVYNYAVVNYGNTTFTFPEENTEK